MPDPKAPAAPSDEVPTPPTPSPEQFMAWLSRQILPPPETAPEIRASKWSKEQARDFLLGCPQLPVFIPLEIHEMGKRGPFFESVIWNGWEWRVEKAVQTTVPEPIAQILYQGLAKERTQQFITQNPWDCLVSGPVTIRGETFGGKLITGG